MSDDSNGIGRTPSSGPGDSNVDIDELVPLPPSLLRHFYESIVLECSINEITKNNAVRQPSTPSIDHTQSQENAFKCFLNKLSQLCDNKRGGDTVTACTAQRLPEGLRFVFASNSRSNEEREAAKSYVRRLFVAISCTTSWQAIRPTDALPTEILQFNKPRVVQYLKALVQQSPTCMQRLQYQPRENNEEQNGEEAPSSLFESLSDLNMLATEAKERSNTEDYISVVGIMLDRLEKFRKHHMDEVSALAKEGRIDSQECWCELRHVTGRLLSYKESIYTLMSAKRNWPQLFEEPKILWLPSSRPMDKSPLGKKSETAHAIIGRVASNPEEIEFYRAKAVELQSLDLDGVLKEKIKRPSWRPIVHAEVLMLDWLDKNGFRNESDFFGAFRYVASSKPTCRMCHYYFLQHISWIQGRVSHRNLYPNWRVPDLHVSDGKHAKKTRENIVREIEKLQRKDLRRVLEEKVPERRKHDSNTEISRFSGSSTRHNAPGGLENGMKPLLEAIEEIVPSDSTSGDERYFTVDEADNTYDSEDSEDGGVRLV